MIFGTWRSYFISWQIFENKLWCPVSKKIRRYFHFLLSLAYPIDRPDWALFSVVILFCCWRKLKFGPLFCPATSPRFWSFYGAGRGGEPPLPRSAGRGVHPWLLPAWNTLSDSRSLSCQTEPVGEKEISEARNPDQCGLRIAVIFFKIREAIL